MRDHVSPHLTSDEAPSGMSNIVRICLGDVDLVRGLEAPRATHPVTPSPATIMTRRACRRGRHSSRIRDLADIIPVLRFRARKSREQSAHAQ